MKGAIDVLTAEPCAHLSPLLPLAFLLLVKDLVSLRASRLTGPFQVENGTYWFVNLNTQLFLVSFVFFYMSESHTFKKQEHKDLVDQFLNINFNRSFNITVYIKLHLL